MYWRGVISEITYLLGHERVMQVMRNCSPTCLVVEGGGGGGRKSKEGGGWQAGVCC